MKKIIKKISLILLAYNACTINTTYTLDAQFYKNIIEKKDTAQLAKLFKKDISIKEYDVLTNTLQEKIKAIQSGLFASLVDQGQQAAASKSSRVIKAETCSHLKLLHPEGIRSFFAQPQWTIGKALLAKKITKPTNKPKKIELQQKTLERIKNNNADTWISNNKSIYTSISDMIYENTQGPNAIDRTISSLMLPTGPLSVIGFASFNITNIRNTARKNNTPEKIVRRKIDDYKEKINSFASHKAERTSFNNALLFTARGGTLAITQAAALMWKYFIKNPSNTWNACKQAISSPIQSAKALYSSIHTYTAKNSPRSVYINGTGIYNQTLGAYQDTTKSNTPGQKLLFQRLTDLQKTITFIDTFKAPEKSSLEKCKNRLTEKREYKDLKQFIAPFANTSKLWQYTHLDYALYTYQTLIAAEKEYRDVLHEILYFMGQIDSYNAINKTIEQKKLQKANKTKKNEKLSISHNQVKNPVNNKEKAESISIDKAHSIVPRALPKEKTNYLQSIVYNQLLAQTIGYTNTSTKQTGKVSNFDRIIYRGAASENMQKGLSTGTAQLQTFANLKGLVSAKEKSLVILNNPLAGTTVTLGKKLIHQYKKQLQTKEFKNNVRSIITTNFTAIPKKQKSKPQQIIHKKITTKKNYQFLANQYLPNNSHAENTAKLWGNIQTKNRAHLIEEDILYLGILGENGICNHINKQNQSGTHATWGNLQLAQTLTNPLTRATEIIIRRNDIQEDYKILDKKLQEKTEACDWTQSIINKIQEYKKIKHPTKWSNKLKHNAGTLALYRMFKQTKNDYIKPYIASTKNNMILQALPNDSWNIRSWLRAAQNSLNAGKKAASIKAYFAWLHKWDIAPIAHAFKKPSFNSIVQGLYAGVGLGKAGLNTFAKLTLNDFEIPFIYTLGSKKYKKNILHNQLNSIRELAEFIHNDNNFVELSEYGELKKLRDELIQSPEFKELAQEVAFTKDWNWLQRQTKALKLIVLFRRIMSDQRLQKGLANMTKFIGSIQSCIWLQKFKQNSKINPIHPIKTHEPHIYLKDAVYPLLGNQKPIANTLRLGDQEKKSIKRNMYLVAPNGSGKSFLQKTILLNTIMAQTTGFAFAKKGSLITPFDVLGTTSNMTKSDQFHPPTPQELFERTKNIVDKKNNKNKKVFVIIDEPLSALHHQQAQERIPELLDLLEENKQAVSMIATHFDIPSADKRTSFKNGTMEVIDNDPSNQTNVIDDNEFTTTFKLQDNTKNNWWFEGKAKSAFDDDSFDELLNITNNYRPITTSRMANNRRERFAVWRTRKLKNA